MMSSTSLSLDNVPLNRSLQQTIDLAAAVAVAKLTLTSVAAEPQR